LRALTNSSPTSVSKVCDGAFAKVPNPHAKEASDNFYNNVHRGRRQVENMLKSDTTKLDSILKNQQGQMYRLLEEEQKRMRLLGLDTGR
jgi:hypothetical protein